VHKAVVVTGESFIIVEPAEPGSDEKAEKKVRIFANAPHLCHVFYEEDNPRSSSTPASGGSPRARRT